MRKGTWFLRIVLGGLAPLVIAVGLIPFPIMLREMFTHAPHHLNIVVVVLGIGIYLAIIGFWQPSSLLNNYFRRHRPQSSL